MHEPLTAEELRRYGRQIIMPEVGIEGQRRLKDARVLCVGVGGLGSPLAAYLAASGVGTIGLIDFDEVETENLHRQILHFSADVGRLKVHSAAEKLHSMNPHVKLESHPARLCKENALQLVSGYEVIADGTDNFAARYLVNDACIMLGKPNVHAAIFRFEGQLSVFGVGDGPCYRCLFPDAPAQGSAPSCAEAGVLGVLPGILGSLQAAEVIKLILGIGEPLIGRMLMVDAAAMEFRTVTLRKDPNCPVCGISPSITDLVEETEVCIDRGQDARGPTGTEHPMTIPSITPEQLVDEMKSAEPPALLDVREDFELQIACLQNKYHIPLGSLPGRLEELDRTENLVVYCRSGARSAQATLLLQAEGFTRVRNLKDGILGYSDRIDPSLKKY